MATLTLIDGSGFIYRAYHAIPHLSTTKGVTTNAVYGFTTGKMAGKQWKCAQCKAKFSIRVGTIFEDSKIPLRKWLAASCNPKLRRPYYTVRPITAV